MTTDGRAGRHGEIDHEDGKCRDCLTEDEVTELKAKINRLRDALLAAGVSRGIVDVIERGGE